MNDANEANQRSVARIVLKEAVWIGATIVLALLVVAAGLSLAFRGWGDAGRTDGIYAQNRTDGNLRFRMLLETGWYSVLEIAKPYPEPYSSTILVAGPSLLDGNRCTTGPIVALDGSGREVARREAPVCLGEDGQELWVVGGAGASPSS